MLGWITIIFAFCTFALPLAAQDGSQAKISKKDCRVLTEHQPNADVAYKPGVDVRGKPVAPADLSSNRQVQLPETVALDILIPLSVFRPGHRVRRGARLDVDAGSVTVDLKTGKASYNGQPLNAAEQQELYRFCRQQKN